MSEPSPGFRPNGHPPLPGATASTERWWDDDDFQDRLCALLVHDQHMLQECASLLDEKDFKPLRGSKHGLPRQVVIDRALEHFNKYREPLGKLARVDVLEYAAQISMGVTGIEQLRQYIDFLENIKLVASDSIAAKVVTFKAQKRKAAALQEMAELQLANQLSDEKWLEITRKTVVSEEANKMIDAPQWPEALGAEAYQGLAGDIVRAIEPHTEASSPALLVQTLVLFGNVIDRGPHWKHSATEHALNLYVAIVGPTGQGKGSGLDLVREMFRDVDLAWSVNPNIYSGLSTGEGLIHMVRDETFKRNKDKDGELVTDDPGVPDKRMVVVQPEFAGVLQVCERTGNTLPTILRNAWDGVPLGTSNKNSPIHATGAHISLIVHSTEEDLRALMSRSMILNGFGNRFLWVCSRRSKAKPFGGEVPKEKRDPLVQKLCTAVEFASTRGRMFFEKRAAANLWVKEYATTLTRDCAVPMTGRAFAQVRRMATIYALMDCSEQVGVQHLRAALETWRYCAASARFIFGGVHRVDPLEEKALDALRKAKKEGLTRKQIYVDVFQGNKTSDEITRVLAGLQKEGRARMVLVPAGANGGRPVERWFDV